MSHNGEINTLRGNVNWMRAREGMMKSDLFGDDLHKLFPVVEPDCSDSGVFDNALEFLLMNGRTLQGAVMMMVPEAWQKHQTMSERKRAFYEYNSCVMEPWDGPASISFTAAPARVFRLGRSPTFLFSLVIKFHCRCTAGLSIST